MHTKLNELANASTCITHHEYAPYGPACIRDLLIINTHLRRLRAYTLLPLSVGVLRAFVLPCVELLQLKDKVRFVCALQWTIHPLSHSSLLFYHIKLFYMLFFISLILRYWLHDYLYNYFATAIFSHFLFCFFLINLTNIQFSHNTWANVIKIVTVLTLTPF